MYLLFSVTVSFVVVVVVIMCSVEVTRTTVCLFYQCKTALFQLLIDWINDELADQRIIVKDLEEDLFDGQILQKLIGMHCIAS